MSKQAYATRSPTLTKLSTPFTKRWPELFDFVSTLSVSHRKLLITLCRSGVFPDYATTLHTKMLPLLNHMDFIDESYKRTDTIGYENLLDWLTHRSKACPSVYRIIVIDSIPEFYWNDPFDQYEVFAFTQETTVDTRLASILYDANELDY